MAPSNRNSGIAFVKTAQLKIFKRKLVKVAKAEGERLRHKAAEDKKYRTWKYIAGRVRELKNG